MILFNNPNEIVNLNIGGTTVSASKKILTKFQGSLLSDMFSEDISILNKDENGKIFIDRNPKIFNYVLDYIRSDRKFSPEDLD